MDEMADKFFDNAEISGEIKSKPNNRLLVKSGNLYKVRCASDVFWVAARNKDQVRKLLNARGGEQNLKEYTIKRHFISYCEMIYAEVADYETVLSQSKFLEDNDLTDTGLDIDE